MRITVFAGSSMGTRPEFQAAAADLGTTLARAGIGVVYGGGGAGLMGVLAGAALDAGGEVIGVIPEALVESEAAKQELTRLDVVTTMHARKERMAELGDAFAALPGGMGTLEELFEVLTWRQLRLHDKPVALINVAGAWDPLLAALDAAVADGFIRPASRQRLIVVDSPAGLLAALSAT